MQGLIDFYVANQVMILGVALALSEGLSLVPGVKANGIFQLVFGWLKSKKDAPKA
jgi:hydrogenase/urease accessory protein HupE